MSRLVPAPTQKTVTLVDSEGTEVTNRRMEDRLLFILKEAQITNLHLGEATDSIFTLDDIQEKML